jgi:hypothetical protein
MGGCHGKPGVVGDQGFPLPVAPGAPPVPGEVHQDGAGIRRRVLPGRRPSPGRAQQRRLHQVLGVLVVPRQQQGKAEQPAAVADDVRLELRLVADGHRLLLS